MTTGGGPKLQAMIGAIVRDADLRRRADHPAKKIVRSGDTSYMAVRLPAGMRAMSLPINVESAAGGFIQPGDRVDVMSTHADASKNGGGMVTETVLANALVLAIDQQTDAPKAGASLVGATVTSRSRRPAPARWRAPAPRAASPWRFVPTPTSAATPRGASTTATPSASSGAARPPKR